MFRFILFIAIYLPFQLALNPTSGIDLASIRVIILILFLIWLAEGLRKKNILIKRGLQSGLIAAFLFFNVISVIAARNADWSFRKIIFLLSIFPIYFVASSVLTTKEKIIKTIKAVVASGSLVAVIGVFQFFSQFIFGTGAVYRFWAENVIPPFLGKTFSEAVLKNPSWLVNIGGKTYLRATAIFPDPHMLSFFIGLILPLSVGLLFYMGKDRWMAVIASLVILIADILTFSRGGYLGLFAALVFAGFLLHNKISKKYKVAMVVTIVAGVLILFIPSPVSKRFASSFNIKEGSNQGRLIMWKKALDVSLSNPLIGVGIGNYPLEVDASAGYREPIYAHNTYLDIAAETGVINTFLWVGLLGMSMVYFWKNGIKEKILLFAGISILIFSVHSMVETAIYSPVVLTLFLLIMSFNIKDADVGYEKTN